jgi:hypothetical protein
MLGRAPLASYEDILEPGQLPQDDTPVVLTTNISNNETVDEEDGQVSEAEEAKRSSRGSDPLQDALDKLSKTLKDQSSQSSLKNNPRDKKDTPQSKAHPHPHPSPHPHPRTQTQKALDGSRTRGRDGEKDQIRRQPSQKPLTPFVPRVVCRYYMEGRCSKGDKCTFSHAVKPNVTADQVRQVEPCKFHIAGSCMKGAACQFSHDLSGMPCKFHHLWKRCSAGEACRFSHAPISNEARQALVAEAANSADSNKGDQRPSEPAHSQNARLPKTESSPESADFLLLNPFASGDFE